MLYLASSILAAVFVCLIFSWYVAGGLNGLMVIYFSIFLAYTLPFNALLVYLFGALACRVNMLLGSFLFAIFGGFVGYIFYLILFNKNSISYSPENGELVVFYCSFGGATGIISFLFLRFMNFYGVRNVSMNDSM
jgi:hypothetical protein